MFPVLRFSNALILRVVSVQTGTGSYDVLTVMHSALMDTVSSSQLSTSPRHTE